MSNPEPYTLYIYLTFLEKDANKNFYHWVLYATGSNPPEGIKFHATDQGNQSNLFRYEYVEVDNPIDSNDLVVCLKIDPTRSLEEINKSLKRVPLGNARALPRREKRWTCRVFLTAALKQLDQDHVIVLPPGIDVDEIEQACYSQADYYHDFNRRTGQKGPAVVNDASWLRQSFLAEP